MQATMRPALCVPGSLIIDCLRQLPRATRRKRVHVRSGQSEIGPQANERGWQNLVLGCTDNVHTKYPKHILRYGGCTFTIALYDTPPCPLQLADPSIRLYDITLLRLECNFVQTNQRPPPKQMLVLPTPRRSCHKFASGGCNVCLERQ